MTERKRNKAPLFAVIFIVTAVIAVVLLINIFNHNIIIKPGTITYDESLSSAERDFLENAFSGKTLEHDVTISAFSETTAENPANFPNFTRIVYDTQLPVSNFYNVGKDLSPSEALALTTISEPNISEDDNNFYLISIRNINDTVRAATIAGNSYFDYLIEGADQNSEFKGAVFRSFKIDSSAPAEAYSIISSALSETPNAATTLSINQTGVTALTRRMLMKLNAVGNASFFSEHIADFLARTDFTHTSNEVSFADGCNNSADMAFCADPRMLAVLTNSGVNIVELTGNHNNDWGADANLKTIELYHENNMHTFGGGENASTAAEPLEIVNKDNSITWLAVNLSTSTKENGQGATASHPGANIYDEARDRALIAEAKAAGNFVIVDVQYFECYSYPDDGEEMPSCDAPISGQAEFFRSLIDAGADMVVGTQAHQPQTFELYHGKPIYYGLGNLFFDQINWPGTSRSLVLTHFFYKDRLLQTIITPTVYDSNFQTSVMDKSSAAAFLTRLSSANK